MKNFNTKFTFLFSITILISLTSYSQTFSGCDLAAIRAAFATQGARYTELAVPGQTCSMYFIDNNSLDAAQAETDANAYGAHLAVINDAAENTNVFNALTAGGYLAGNATVWIGYKRVSTGSPLFYTLDGSTGNFLPPTSPGGPTPGIYQNWAANEPNNNGYQCSPVCGIGCNAYECSNGEQCVQIRSSGLWNDLPCNQSSKSLIEVNLCPRVTASNDTLVCNGGGATLKATSILGSNPTVFTWNPGTLTGSTQTVFPAAPTDYIVRATDRYSCYGEDTVKVTINNNCNAPPAPNGCNFANIRAAFAASGGRYTELPVSGQSCSMYFVDNNSLDAAQAETDANLLGAHLVVFNDAAENANVVAALNAGGYLAGGAPVWIGIKRVSANNPQFFALDGTTGNFTPGGSTPYQNWAAGEPNNSKPGCCNTPILGNTCITTSDRYKCTNGEQCVQIYSGGQWNDLSCDRTSKSVIEVNLCPDLRGTPNDTTLCNNSTLNIRTNTILGSQPYTYSWTPGGQTTANVTVTPPLGNTTYYAKATDRYGCFGQDTFRVTTITTSAPIISSSPTPATICISQNLDLNYNVTTYSPTAIANWGLDGGTTTSTAGQVPYSSSWATSGIKNVTLFITDRGCTSPTTTFPVTVNPNPIADAVPDFFACSGQNYNLGIAPVPGTSYAWLPTAGLSDPTISNPVFNAINSTTSNQIQGYRIIATANGCIASDTVTITVYPAIDNSFSVTRTALCTVETDTITYTGTNSTAATFNWNFDGGTVLSGSGAGPYVVQWSAIGTKNVILSVTQNGCSDIPDTIIVTVGNPPAVDAGVDQTVCSGGAIQIGSAPVSGFTYSWDDGSVLDDSLIANPIFSFFNFSNSAVNIPLTVTANQNGCTASDQVIITVNAPDPTDIIALGDTLFCEGSSVDLASTDGNLIAVIWTTQETTPTITVDSSGVFALIGLDIQGCLYVSNTITTIKVPNPIVNLAVNGIKEETCSNYKDGSISIVASSGTTPYQYQWNTTPVQNSATASNLGAASYSVTVTDKNNCTVQGNYVVNATVVFDLAIDSAIDASCYGFSNGRIYTSPQGGNSPYKYLWSNSKTTRTISNLVAGNYTITATDANNCSTTKSATISQPAEIKTNFGSDIKIDFLESTTINLTVTPGGIYNYIWKPATSLSCADCQNPEASPVSTTTYTVIVQDQSTGCYDTSKVKVEVDASKKIYVPNAFTPNGDSRNEVWKVFTKGVKFFEAKIFNRWGEIVFQSNDINVGWDGTFKGAPVSLGTYPYTLNVTYLDNEVILNKGTITLLK